jgi:hypothetical protein
VGTSRGRAISRLHRAATKADMVSLFLNISVTLISSDIYMDNC